MPPVSARPAATTMHRCLRAARLNTRRARCSSQESIVAVSEPPAALLYLGVHVQNDHEALKRHAEIIRALVRRYKYLQVSLEESFVKILKFLNGFEEENITKLAQTTAFIFSMGANSPQALIFHLGGPSCVLVACGGGNTHCRCAARKSHDSCIVPFFSVHNFVSPPCSTPHRFHECIFWRCT